MKKHTGMDCFLTAVVTVIGLAEAAHLAGVYAGLSFFGCTLLFGGLLGAGAVFGLVFLVIRSRAGDFRKGTGAGTSGKAGKGERVLYVLFAGIVISQLIFAVLGNTVYRARDITLETAGSFLAADGIYRVNPLTGFPYRTGIPARLKILCLPTLYGCFSRMTGLEVEFVVRTLMPAVTILGCYGAYGALGRCLFPGNGKKRACFLLAVSVLIWTGTYLYGMDGFDLLYCGWRGVTIRNGVLLPWLLSLCLRKKWFSAFLCVLAEACIVWTLYGFGVCAVVLLGMAAAERAAGRIAGRKSAGS